MKNYNVITFENETIVWYEQDGVRTSFGTTDPNNSDYAEYLRFTAWVNEGNDPDEFWTQSDQ
jgi:hypothetical protein